MSHSPAPTSAPTHDADHAHDHLINHAAIDVCYEMLCHMLNSSASEVEASASELSVSFRSVAQATSEQGSVLDTLVETLSKLDHKGGHVTLEDFIHMMSGNLVDTVDKVVAISENAMALAFDMEGVVKQLDGIEQFIQQVNQINSQTRMLALNATIEAARAGESGKGFAVVANEVKQVSSHIDTMAREMQEQISSISRTLRNGQKTLGSVAGIDMSANISVRAELDSLMQALLEQNATVSQIMQHSASMVREISSQIANITVSVQFQDRNSQIIANIVSLIKAMRDHEKDPIRYPLPPNPAEALESLASSITLSAIKQSLFETAKARGISIKGTGSRQNLFIHTDTTNSADDVELF